MAKRVWVALAVAATASASPVLAHPQPKGAGAARSEAMTSVLLAPGEGEILLFPDGRRANLKVTQDTTGSKRLMVGTESIPGGTRIPVHSHDGYEEVIFVHEGNPELTLGSQKVRAEPGTIMAIPPGTWHGVANGGEENSTILFIFPEPEIAGFFREVGGKPGEPPPQLTGEDWERIMTEHRMRAYSE